MASEPKPTPPGEIATKPSTPAAAPAVHREQGVRIFSYPKVVFMFPTLIVALICGLGMTLTGNHVEDPKRVAVQEARAVGAPVPAEATVERLNSPADLFGMLFLGVFAFNLLVMALDFPRFTILAGIVGGLFLIFFFLWLGAYFQVNLLGWFSRLLASIFVGATSGFYYLIVVIMLFIYATIYITRYLDYWEIRPNEILRHHGPLSDLERFPTMNLKFDKEIPDVLEYLFLGSGRIVLNIPGQTKAVVLDNVLFINSIEKALKGLMSRMEVRVTTDKEVTDS